MFTSQAGCARMGFKNYKRNSSFDFVSCLSSYHAFIISFRDFERKMIVINHVFWALRLPWGKNLSLLHVSWLSEGKLILVLEPSCISFIHISVYLTWLTPKDITGLLAGILRHILTFWSGLPHKMVFGFKKSPYVRWEGIREKKYQGLSSGRFYPVSKPSS